MNEDPRCCGSGTCIINTEGLCWCGQHWDGQKMSLAPLDSCERTETTGLAQQLRPPTGSDSTPAA
jgi:hypothetical protein